MDSYLLDGVRAKLDRAVENFNEFEAEVSAWRERDPYKLVGSYEPNGVNYEGIGGGSGPCYVHRIRLRVDPPLRIGVLLGDTVHNLRSALDQIVRRIAEHEGNVPSDSSRWPIWNSDDEFVDNVLKPAQRGRSNALQGIPISSDAWTIIRDSQPGNFDGPASHAPLRILDDLWNEDKHNVVLATVGVITESPATIPRHQPNKHVERVVGAHHARGGPLEDGAPVWVFEIVPSGPDPKVDVEYEPVIGIGFGEKLVSGAVLPGLIGEVVRLIRALMPTFDWPWTIGAWGLDESLPGS